MKEIPETLTLPTVALALVLVSVAVSAFYFGRSLEREATTDLLKRMKMTADEKRAAKVEEVVA